MHDVSMLDYSTSDYAALLSPEDHAFLTRTFKLNGSKFGGWRMEADDEGSDEDAGSEDQESEGQEDSDSDADSDEDDTDSGDGSSDDGDGLTEEDLRSALAATRKESARYRTRVRDLERSLAQAKTADEFEAALDEFKSQSAADAHELIKENVALKHGLPDDLAEVLTGTTRDELEAHAKKLKKYAPSEAKDDPEVEGGLTPRKKKVSSDDVTEAVHAALRRRH